MNANRIYSIKYAEAARGPVVCWMSRDQRVADNWALLHAAELAAGSGAPLAVVFCIVPEFLGATWRQYAFMLAGLQETEAALAKKNIPLFVLKGADPGEAAADFCNKHKAAALVCDFDPLREKRAWKKKAAELFSGRILEVDAHNIVPCRVASQKQEFGAYTLRPKINSMLDEFLHGYPTLKPCRAKWPGAMPRNDWEKISSSIKADRSIKEAPYIMPGEKAAKKALADFIKNRLNEYHTKRNDPCAGAVSGLSPYLHFGQLSAQRVALDVSASDTPREAKDALLEELIVRRELSDNFCFYNEDYDNIGGLPAWGRATLDAHRRDKREYVYSFEQFEGAKTHDTLWNAAQNEMRIFGKMHGYMRMYWAKKILEWSASPEEAFRIAAALNDRYELDGRDPNGYAGIAWSIGGLHDRAWSERPVSGKVRYMNRKGCERKFDVQAYISMIERAEKHF